MVGDFFSLVGIWNNEQYSVTIQPNGDKCGEKWEEFLYWKLETYKYQVFFCQGHSR